MTSTPWVPCAAAGRLVAEADDLRGEVAAVWSMVGLAVEDRDPGRAAGTVHFFQPRNRPLGVNRGLAFGILGVQIDVEGVEEEHRRLAGDNREVSHGYRSCSTS